MSTINQTLVKHGNQILPPPVTNGTKVDVKTVATVLIELQKLGYVVDQELTNILINTTPEQFIPWGENLILAVADLKGANYTHTPMYPNFPKQVADTPEIELYLNAIIHYMGSAYGLTLLPEYTVEPRETLDTTNITYTVLKPANTTTIETLFTNLVTSKLSLNTATINDLKTLHNTLGYLPAIPNIPNKTNYAEYVNLAGTNPERFKELLTTITNPTDILRILAAQTGSDPALKGHLQLPKTTRPNRKNIIERLNQFSIPQILDAYHTHPRLWKTITKHLHVSEYPQYQNVQQATTLLRNGKTYNTFNRNLEQAIQNTDITKTINLLQTRPTLFVRRVKEIATKFPEGWQTAYLNIAREATLTSLYQALNHFETKNNTQKLVTTIGRDAKTLLIPETNPLTPETKKQLATLTKHIITQKLRTLPTLGKVYHKPNPLNPTIPFGLQNSNNTDKLIGRGTRTKFNPNETLRFFIHWANMENGQRVDIDLSATVLDEKFNRIIDIAYYNLKNIGAVHSGDITNAPEGASEFIDLHLPTLKQTHPNAHYIAMSGIVFTGQQFNTIPETTAGYMVREGNPQQGEIFDARTVNTAFKITNTTRSTIPLLFNIHTGEATWLDLNENITRAQYNLAHHRTGETSILAYTTNKKYTTITELLTDHINARATETVNTREEADTIIDETTITIPEILTNWL